jgi:hypothetical protein
MAELSRLPQPIASEWEWQYEGACRSMDPEMFFVDAIVKMQLRRSAPVAQSSMHVANMRSLFKNPMEFGAVSQKMIALLF